MQLKSNEPNWLRNRGVEQRNEAIDWLRQHHNSETSGVVYFGDDNNTYDLQLFEEVLIHMVLARVHILLLVLARVIYHIAQNFDRGIF